jgi:hypothetical protein
LINDQKKKRRTDNTMNKRKREDRQYNGQMKKRTDNTMMKRKREGQTIQ